ncbi:MAG: 50S ribosomal protein L4, partial [Myxococcales bacterium]|nr:50S ribosomal protein L4 [Myxococcales bacterium]
RHVRSSPRVVVDLPENDALHRSVRNLADAKFSAVEEITLVDLLYYDDLVVSDRAVERLNTKFHTELSRKERELREASHA